MSNKENLLTCDNQGSRADSFFKRSMRLRSLAEREEMVNKGFELFSITPRRMTAN